MRKPCSRIQSSLYILLMYRSPVSGSSTTTTSFSESRSQSFKHPAIAVPPEPPVKIASSFVSFLAARNDSLSSIKSFHQRNRSWCSESNLARCLPLYMFGVATNFSCKIFRENRPLISMPTIFTFILSSNIFRSVMFHPFQHRKRNNQFVRHDPKFSSL